MAGLRSQMAVVHWGVRGLPANRPQIDQARTRVKPNKSMAPCWHCCY